jgi:hypothetical protein
MELIERIEQIIKYKQLSVSGFEKKISASDGVIRRAIRNKTDIYSRFLVEITDNFPDISAEWLLREEGNIIRETEDRTPKKSERQPESDVILGLMNKIEDLARENGQLQAEVNELKRNLPVPRRGWLPLQQLPPAEPRPVSADRTVETLPPTTDTSQLSDPTKVGFFIHISLIFNSKSVFFQFSKTVTPFLLQNRQSPRLFCQKIPLLMFD